MKQQKEIQRVLLADDHQIVRQGLRWILEEVMESFELKEASTLAGLLKLVASERFDFIVLDAQFPDGNGIQVIPEIKNIQPEVKILVFTSFREEEHALRFLEKGADGFLSKESSEEQIKSAIEEILLHGYYHSPLADHLLKLSSRNPALSNPLSVLSQRELEVAKLLAKGLGNLEISSALDLKQNTVSTFKRRIMDKLGLSSLVELIDLVQKHDLEA